MDVEEIEGYDPSNRAMAMAKVIETGGMLCGLIYQDKTRKSYEHHVPGFREEPLAEQDLELTEEQFEELVNEFR